MWWFKNVSWCIVVLNRSCTKCHSARCPSLCSSSISVLASCHHHLGRVPIPSLNSPFATPISTFVYHHRQHYLDIHGTSTGGSIRSCEKERVPPFSRKPISHVARVWVQSQSQEACFAKSKTLAF